MLGLGGSAMLAITRRGPATAIIVLWLGVTVIGLGVMVMWLDPALIFKAPGPTT